MDFISFSPEDIATMRKTRLLLDEYNATAFDDGAQRSALLHEMLGSCGEDVTIQTLKQNVNSFLVRQTKKQAR